MKPSQKGAWAEAEIFAAAVRMELFVLRPMSEGGRYDLAIDLEPRILRIQVKWASRKGDVLVVRTVTSRCTSRGYVKSTYTRHEIDAIGVFSPDVDRCYLIPVEDMEGRTGLHLRLAPSRNNQEIGVRWAADYDFETQIRRLQETPRAGPQPLRPPYEVGTINGNVGL